MMPPVKFGLFKARSREHQDPPSTENLLQNSGSFEQVATPSSPIPSTSKGPGSEHFSPDMSNLHLGSEDEEAGSAKTTPARRASSHSTNSVTKDSQVAYQHLTNHSSSEFRHDDNLPLEDDNSTTYDVNSIQFDETSIAPSEDTSVYCLKRGGDKHKKDMKNKDMQMRDLDMWRASDIEVMQNLLNRSSNQNDQFKWEAIATARGLCTLTDNCTCPDCKRAKYLAGVADGDGGLGAAPFIGAVNGCILQ